MKIHELFEKLENEITADYVFRKNGGDIIYMNKAALEYTPAVSEGDQFFRKICGRRTACPDCPSSGSLGAGQIKVFSDSLCAFGNVTFSAYDTEEGPVIVSRWNEKNEDVLEASGLFSTKEALEALGGERSIYDSIIRTYYEDGRKKSESITTHKNNKDFAALRIEVHGLKSASNIIGAIALGDLCRKLEYACRDIVDADKDLGEIERITPEEARVFIDENIGTMLKDYQKVLDTIGRYLEQSGEEITIDELTDGSGNSDSAKTDNNNLTDKTDINDLIKQASELLDDYEIDESRENIEKAMQLVSDDATAAVLKKALSLIDCFDYDAVQEVLKEFIAVE